MLIITVNYAIQQGQAVHKVISKLLKAINMKDWRE